MIAGIAAWFTLFQYMKDERVRRKDTLLPLITEFEDDAHNMNIAKDMLDGFKYPKGYWKIPNVPYDWYQLSQKRIFRKHGIPNDPIRDAGEFEIRNSFDALLDFFGKLGYLLEVKLVKKKELEYFRYYIEKAIDSDSIGLYLSNYEFKLYHYLLAKLKYEQKGYVKKH